MRFSFGGDAEHCNYTSGANAAFLLLFVHVLPFTMPPGSKLAFVFYLHAHVRTAIARYRAFTTVREDSALYSLY